MGKKAVRSTIGCDPEFFMVNEKGELISAIGKIPGSKFEPYMLDSGAGLQTDNVAIEFASAVATDGPSLVKNIRETMAEISKLMPAGTDIAAIPSADFPEAELQDEEAKAFGCSPDYDAWSLKQNEMPEDINPNFRSCGGHLHVGHVEGDGNEFLIDFDGRVTMVKMMDCFHGVISTMLDNSPEAVKRRKLYGAAGCHRPTDYGLEYRVLSNYWMQSPQLVMLQDALIQDCLQLIRENKAEALIEAIGGDHVVATINGGNVGDAEAIVKNHLLPNMSDDSRGYFEECSANIGNYNIKEAWA